MTEDKDYSFDLIIFWEKGMAVSFCSSSSSARLEPVQHVYNTQACSLMSKVDICSFDFTDLQHKQLPLIESLAYSWPSEISFTGS